MSEAIILEQGIPVAPSVAAGQSVRSMAWRQLCRKRTALAGLGIIILLIMTAVLADQLEWVHLTTYPYFEAYRQNVQNFPFYNQAYQFFDTTWLEK